MGSLDVLHSTHCDSLSKTFRKAFGTNLKKRKIEEEGLQINLVNLFQREFLPVLENQYRLCWFMDIQIQETWI